MTMRFVRAAIVCTLSIAPSLRASDVTCGPDRTGIVCLDRASGMPLWEYFPDEPGPYAIRTDGSVVYRIGGRFWQYYDNPTPKSWDELLVVRIDPETGRELESSRHARVPRPDELRPSPIEFSSLFTANGDKIHAGGWNRRAILVTKGDSHEVRALLSLDRATGQTLVVRDTIVYAPKYDDPYRPRSSPGVHPPKPDGPTVVALDDTTLDTLWTIDDGDPIIGLWSIDRRLYIASKERLRVVDAASGRLVWQQHLERLWSNSNLEKNGDSLFVTCSYWFSECSTPQFLYCLDNRTGNIRWQHDLRDVPLHSRLVFDDTRIYTRIAPSKFIDFWRANAGSKRYYRRDGPEKKWSSRTTEVLANAFAEKTPEEIELNLRAWHALGDGAALSLLRAAKEYLADGPFRHLPCELIDTFPRRRQPLAMIDFLAEQFDSHPHLRTEVGRIVDEIRPEPYWYDQESCGSLMTKSPCPKFNLLPERQALIEGWYALKALTDATPTERFTREAVSELMQKKRFAEFDSLVAAHESSTDTDERMLLRLAIFAQHPVEGSDWALDRLDQISNMEIVQWVQRVPVEWLLEHGDLYLSWLLHEDRSVQSFAGGRIPKMADTSPALPICKEFLQRSLQRETIQYYQNEINAMQVIGDHGSRRHIRLLKRFMACQTSQGDGSSPPTESRSCARPYGVKKAAADALKKLGVRVSVPPPPPRGSQLTEAQIDRKAYHDEVNRVEREMYRAWSPNRMTEAKALALQLIVLLEEET